MSQLKVNTIRHTGASSDAITLASDGTATAKITNNLSNRNLIINGAMRVAQRGTSSTSSGYQTVDRWKDSITGQDEQPTRAQVDVTSNDSGPWEKGFTKALRITNGNQSSGAGAGDKYFLEYRVEAQDIASSGWQYTSASSYITLSFWIKSSVAQTFQGYLLTLDGTNYKYPYNTGALSADTWTKVTKTIPGNSNLQIDNDNGAGFLILLAPFIGTDFTDSVSDNAWSTYSSSARTNASASTWWTTNDAEIELTGIQLEVGDTATDFEHRSYGEDLAQCQRYHYVHVDGNTQTIGIGAYSGTATVYIHVPFPVTMRTTPTMTVANDGTNYWYTWYSSDTSNAEKGDNFAINGAHERGAIIKDPSASGTNGAALYGRTSSASAKISFSAEL